MKKILEIILLAILIFPLFFLAFFNQMDDLLRGIFGTDWWGILFPVYALIFLGTIIFFVVSIFRSSGPKRKGAIYFIAVIVLAIPLFYFLFALLYSASISHSLDPIFNMFKMHN